MNKYIPIYDVRYGGWTVFKYNEEMTILFHAGPFSEKSIAESEAKRLNDLENGLLKLLRTIANLDCRIASEIDGSISCWYCNAYLENGNTHDNDCLYLELKKLLGE